jgi:hypothetical protein
MGGMKPIILPHLGRADLPPHFAALGFTRGAEVGVWKGGFSEQLCRQIPGLELLCVDPWAPYAEYRERKNNKAVIDAAYTEATRRLAPYRCDLRRAFSVDAARTVADKSLDFVFLDANHEYAYVRQDIDAWTPKIRSGGILAGHDYRVVDEKPFIEVKQAVDDYMAVSGIPEWFVLEADRTPSFYWVVP